MKNSLLFSSVLCVVIGLLVGGLLPMPWDEAPSVPTMGQNTILPPDSPNQSATPPAGSTSSPAPEKLDPTDNFPLLNTACAVCRSLKEQDYAALATFVHPEKGVTFTPYSTVNFDTDRTMSAQEVKSLAGDPASHIWGYLDGRDTLIELTNQNYFAQFVFNVDYTQAPEIGVDRVMTSGNALENLSQAYPGCRFVDFSFPLLDANNQGLDWCSLKLVFEPSETNWQLVGIIHGQWTA